MNFVSSIALNFKDGFSEGIRSASSSLAGLTASLGTLGANSSMNRLASDLATQAASFGQFSSQISGMIDKPSELAAAFDSSMRNIQSLTSESDESLAELSSRLLNIGSTADAGPNAIADAFYNIASGVSNASVRMDTLTAAIALSESGQADLGAATSGLIAAVNAYGTPAEHITDMSDVFFQTVKKGVGSLDGFVSSMSSIAGLSASVGVGFDELGSAMAFVTSKGQTESVAATQLKAVMTSFLKPSSDMQKALESIGMSSGSSMLQEYGLAESISMLQSALGGSQDSMAKALGSTEALQAATMLADSAYSDFAASYADGLSGAVGEGLVQQEKSFENSTETLKSLTDSLQIQIGLDVNKIKGFFIDMQVGFLQDVVQPIMNSPVGGAFSQIVAFAAVGTQGFLNLGSGALTAASQMTTLAANIQNAGGFANMFKSTLGIMGAPLTGLGTIVSGVGKTIVSSVASMGTAVIGALPAIGSYIAAGWASATAWIAATWPILAVIAAVAAVAAGVYLLVKNWGAVSAFFAGLWEKIKGAFSAAWEWIKNLIFGTSDWILAAVALFVPIIGIPALIMKHWDVIKSFFTNLWANVSSGITAAWTAIGGFFTGFWEKIKGVFSAAWEWIKNLIFGTSDWILGAVALFVPVIGIPALIMKHWDAIKAFFSSLWTNVSAGITSTWTVVSGFFTGLWTNIASGITSAWTAVSGFFTGLWESISSGITSAWTAISGFFTGLWESISSGITSAWTAVSGFFTGLWTSISAGISGFVNWVSGIIAPFLTPFQAISDGISRIFGGIKNVVGGVIDGIAGGLSKIGSLFGITTSTAAQSGAALNTAFASGITATSVSPTAAFAQGITPIADMMPHSDAKTGPLSELTASGRALTETFATGMESASLIDAASAVFSGASPGIAAPMGDDAHAMFPGTLPAFFNESIDFPAPQNGQTQPASGSSVIHIQNLYLQADECESLLDFVRLLMQAAYTPGAA